MNVDLRRFNYPLTALILKRKWSLDTAVKELAIKMAAERGANEKVTQLRGLLDTQCEVFSQHRKTRFDPRAEVNMMSWLVDLQSQLAVAISAEESAKAEVVESRLKLTEQQRHVELLTEHKDKCFNDFTTDEVNRGYKLLDNQLLEKLYRSNIGRVSNV